MKNIFYILVFSLSFSVFSQTSSEKGQAYVQGQILYAEDDEAVELASIRILSKIDSSYVKGSSSNEEGRFSIKLNNGDYVFQISYTGFQRYYGDFKILSDTILNLGIIYLQEDAIMLKEAIVEAKIPDIVVRGDTVEYNAASYLRDESSMLRDLVRNIPGIEVDENDNITANGKPVKKILLDGKEFFGNDIAMALSNLPADQIKKIQLFKEESDQAKLTGFKDKNPAQVLNLEVKEELKRSIFGELTGGYGNRDSYMGRAVISYLYEDNQASLIANIGNVPAGDYPSYQSGIDKNQNLGFNFYRQSSDKFRIGGSIRYSGNDNKLETESDTETFLPDGDRFSQQKSSNNTGRDAIAGAYNLHWEIDSLTTIYANSYMGYDRSTTDLQSSSLSYVQEGDTTWGESNNMSKTTGYNISNSITVGRKLNNKGRTLTLGLNYAYRVQDRKANNYSITDFSDGSESKIVDHMSTGDIRNNSFSASLSYVEPLGEGYLLQLSYRFDNSYSKRLQDARRKDDNGDYLVVDSAYSRDTRSEYLDQSINIDFQARKEKYNYTIGISLDPSRSQSKINLGDSIIEDTKQTVFNFSPTAQFSYTPNNSTSLDFNYYGNSRQPSIQQRSADTTVVNSMLKYYGNPNLKQSYDNSFNLSYQNSKYEENRFLNINASFNYSINDIVNYSKIDSKGNTVNTYKNVNGNMGANLSAIYNTPFRNKKFTITSTSSISHNKRIGYTNEKKLNTMNYSFNENLSLKFKIDKFETDLKASIYHSITRNNLTNVDNRSTSNFSISNFILAKLGGFSLDKIPFDFAVRNTISYSKYNGYGGGFKSDEILWNASLDIQFLKNKKGLLKIQFFDILKDRSNVSRQVTSNYISDYRTNTQSRYMMLSFSYKFNIFRGINQNQNKN